MRRLQYALPFILVLSLLTLLPAQAAEDPTLIFANDISSTFGVSQPLTDGEHVIWRSSSTSVHQLCTSLKHAILTDHEETTVLQVADGSAVALDDGYLLAETPAVQCEDSDPDSRLEAGVRLVDLADGSIRTLLDNADNIEAVAIDYPFVAWMTAETESDFVQLTIWAMDTSSDSAPTLIETKSAPAGGDAFLFVEGDTVSWVTTYGADGVGNAGRAQIGGTVSYFMSMHDTTQVALAGDTMVTITAGRPLYHDLADGSKLWLSDIEADYVATDGRYIFWAEEIRSAHYLNAYDSLTSARFNIWARGASDGDLNVAVRSIDANGGALVWGFAYYNTWMSAIHGIPLADRLPSAYLADSGVSSPVNTYFPETGHYLAHDFRTFWENNGGLHVFGYPLTEEFDYLNPETGAAYTAQMTERQRFEWHPENIGTPYAVLLGRLGETILQQQGRDWTTFAKADPAADHYFAETGHAIAPEFYAYWTTRGLDLGHPGTSFEESVALFGYPLSEPMLETNADGDTVLTQYFERAVFEYHPDKAEWNPVLLRRLGAELVESWGW